MQVRFKCLPRGKICFGLEMEPQAGGQSKSFLVQQAQRLLLRGLRTAVGSDFYHSTGDDPSKTEGEVEPPSFIMPLWAVDQFIVSESGEEPDLSGDLQGLGKRRTTGTKAYIDAMTSMMADLSCDKVYTFCFWGVSPFVDVVNWQLKGFWPGYGIDAAKLSGEPLVYVVAYDLAPEQSGSGQQQRQRHVASRKRYFFKVALWSSLKPPTRQLLGTTLSSECTPAERQENEDTGSMPAARGQHDEVVLQCTKAAREPGDTRPKSVTARNILLESSSENEFGYTTMQKSLVHSPIAANNLEFSNRYQGDETKCDSSSQKLIFGLFQGSCFACDFA